MAVVSLCQNGRKAWQKNMEVYRKTWRCTEKHGGVQKNMEVYPYTLKDKNFIFPFLMYNISGSDSKLKACYFLKYSISVQHTCICIYAVILIDSCPF